MNKTLHMIELRPDIAALFQFFENQGLFRNHMDHDVAYGVHAWLRAAFGESAPQPFRLLMKRGRPARLLGYAREGAEGLGMRLSEFADPAVMKVCPPERMAGRTMPGHWAHGRILGFQVLCCPVVRRGRVEKDAFLARADVEGTDSGLQRESVYGQWLRRRFGEAAEIMDVRLGGFSLRRLVRRTHPGNGARKARTLVRPSALFEGTLKVRDEAGFSGLLSGGIGRHKAFGFGMLLLRPA